MQHMNQLLKSLIVSGLLVTGAVFAQVNINTATAEELTALSGIGPKKAAAIIKYRKANGKFKSVSDLTQVNGIGEKTIGNLGKDIKTTGSTDLSKLSKAKKKATSKAKSKDKAVKAKAKTKAKTKAKSKTEDKMKKPATKKTPAEQKN